MTIYRVPLPAVDYGCAPYVSACELKIPSSEIYLQISEFIIKDLKLADHNVSIQYIPSTQLDFDENLDILKDDSTLAKIYRGIADISPLLGLTSDTSNLVPNIGPVIETRYAVMYPRVSGESPSLDLQNLSSRTFYLLVLIFGITISLLKCLIKKYWVFLSPSFLYQKLYFRHQVFFGFFLGIFWRYLSSDLVLLFNRQTSVRQPLLSTSDVLDALEAGTYTAITQLELYFDQILYPIHLKGKSQYLDRLIRINENNPALLIKGEHEIMRTLVRTDKNFIFFTDDMDLDYYDLIYNKHCNFSLIMDDQLPVVYQTIYFRKGLNFREAKSADSAMVRQQLLRYGNEQKFRKDCNRFVGERRNPQPLKLQQIQSCFWILLTFCFAGFGLLTGELIRGQLLDDHLHVVC